jgi:hypothetical protein
MEFVTHYNFNYNHESINSKLHHSSNHNRQTTAANVIRITDANSNTIIVSKTVSADTMKQQHSHNKNNEDHFVSYLNAEKIQREKDNVT